MTKIYTIGHSTRKLNAFIKVLILNRIRCLVDVRSYPGSRRVPQFNKENLKKTLAKYKIKYFHIPELGGRRKAKARTIHSSIESPGFRGYADHMMTPMFREGLSMLKGTGRKCKTAYMCAEGPWWRCHRRMISDRLTVDGWDVYHLGIKKEPVAHELWELARVDKSGELVYDR